MKSSVKYDNFKKGVNHHRTGRLYLTTQVLVDLTWTLTLQFFSCNSDLTELYVMSEFNIVTLRDEKLFIVHLLHLESGVKLFPQARL